MNALLVLDQGTTSSRTIVFDQAGQIKTIAQQEFTQIFPKPGWVEHDPEEIWQSQLTTLRDAISRSGIAPQALSCLGITNQRETTVVWHRATGRPIHSAIVWQDRRTASHCDELAAAGHLPLIRERTGLVLDPYFSGTKLVWLQENEPHTWALVEQGRYAVGTVDSYLVARLTRGMHHVTDASNASRTLLFDIHEGAWSEELCAVFRVPREALPEVVGYWGQLAGDGGLDALERVGAHGAGGDLYVDGAIGNSAQIGSTP